MNAWVNYDDMLGQLVAAGLQVDTAKLAVDGRIQRWKTADSRGGDKPGWTRLREWQSKAGHLYVVGCFGIWQGQSDGYTKIDLPKRGDPARPVLSDEDIAAARAAQKAAAKAIADQRKAEQKIAAGWAGQVWAACAPVTEHEYLVRKGIGANGARVFNGLPEDVRLPGVDDANKWRLNKSVGALVVPMHDVDGNVCGLQFIFPRGHEFEGKQFWPTGMGMGGTFGVIGGLRRSGVLLVTEGFATAATLHESTGQPVAYAFSANNLGKAGKQIRARYKQLRILFCADDDYQTEAKTGNNPGVASAQLAASEIEHAAWVKPDFTDEAGADRRAGKKLSDFNDLAQLTGLPVVVANQINAKLDALEWRDAPAMVGAGSGNQGGGEKPGERREAVSVMTLDELVSRFIAIDDQTGDFCFDTWTREVCKRKKMQALAPAGVAGDDVKRHPVFQSRAVYVDQIGFDPGGEDKNIVCNRWGGWPTTPKAGSCDLLLDLLRYQCSGERNHVELFDWVLKWIAYPIQHPGAKMHSAVVVHGPQGTGKSRFWEAYAKIFGEYSTILTQGTIEDKFNADWCERRLFVIADEIVANTEKYHLKNQLKNFITSDWVRINPKNVAAHRERNHMNMVFLSNEIQPVVLENDDRRHCVIYTPKKASKQFYDDVTAEINNGGIEALHQYLLDLDLGDFRPWTEPPMTDAKMRLIRTGAGSEEQFLAAWLEGELDIPFCPIGKSTLYAEYLAFCRREGDPRPRPSKYFWAHVERIGYYVGVTDRLETLNVSHTVSWRCCIPSAEHMDRVAGMRSRWHIDLRQRPAQTKAEWLCGCYFAVEEAISKRKEGVPYAA